MVSLLTGTDLAAACQGGFSISRDKRLDPETPEIELRQDAIAAAAGTSSKLQIWNLLCGGHRAPAVDTRAILLLAAKRLSVTQFIFLTQVALLMSIPLPVGRATSRRDLMLLLTSTGNYGKLGVLLCVGMIGLLMFKLGLSNAHPIIISAIIKPAALFERNAHLQMVRQVR